MDKRLSYGLNLAGSLGALAFMIVAVLTLGWVPVALFIFFILLAIQDARTGTVNVLTFIPCGILLIIYYPAFAIFYFVPPFLVLFFIWWFIKIIKGPLALDPKKTYFGFGDVVGIPLAFTLANVFEPFWGMIAFALVLLISMPIFMRKKTRRLLPWLLPPLATAFIVALII